MARSERDRRRDRERFRKLGEAIEQMDREFPLPPGTPEDRAWILAAINRRRAEDGFPPLEEDDDNAPDRKARDAARRRAGTR